MSKPFQGPYAQCWDSVDGHGDLLCKWWGPLSLFLVKSDSESVTTLGTPVTYLRVWGSVMVTLILRVEAVAKSWRSKIARHRGNSEEVAHKNHAPLQVSESTVEWSHFIVWYDMCLSLLAVSGPLVSEYRFTNFSHCDRVLPPLYNYKVN